MSMLRLQEQIHPPSKRKKANRSETTVGLFLLLLPQCPNLSRRRWDDSFCVCSGRSQKVVQLAGCRGTRPAKRPSRHVLDYVYALPGGNHRWVLAVCRALDCRCPRAVQHVQASHRQSDRRKPHCEECKRGKKLSHEIHLERSYHPQEPPHPLPALVLVFNLSSTQTPLATTLPVLFLRFRLPPRPALLICGPRLRARPWPPPPPPSAVR